MTTVKISALRRAPERLSCQEEEEDGDSVIEGKGEKVKGVEREATRRTTMSMQMETGAMIRTISSPRVSIKVGGGGGGASDAITADLVWTLWS